jgi:cyclomaltodextrinase / maltogenic alpha-amylase / neopullulanase
VDDAGKPEPAGAGNIPDDWPRHAIWWHVYPLGFLGAPPVAPPAAGPPGAPAAPGSEATLESEAAPARLRALGPWLDYLVELGCNGLLLGPVFASETHGYDTVDHFRVDPRLGDEDDLCWLFAQARERGVRVLLDGVFNHVGRGFGPFADAAARPHASPYASWFRRDPAGGTDPATGGPAWATFEGHHQLVALDHEEPAVADHVTEVMTYWLDRGADGWRLDAAYAVPPAFWLRVSDRVKAAHPRSWLVGEMIHGDYTAAVRDGGLDSVTQYELWKAIWSSLNDGNLFELTWALDRHNGYLDRFAPLTFVGNHDVTRLASRLVDPALLPHALVVLLTVGGVPSVYAGDEQGFTGIKEERAGGDDAIRPPFPPDPAGLPPEGWDVYRLHQELIALRRRHPWLVDARTEPVSLDNRVLLYVARGPEPGQRILAGLNLEPAAAVLDCPAGTWRREAGHGSRDGDKLTLPARSWSVLVDT